MSRSIGRRRPAGAARPAAGGAARPGTRPAVRPGRRPAALVVALVASVVAFAAGCTSAVPGHATAGPPPPTTARGAMYLAMLNLAAASAVRYRGSFDNGGDTTGLDATVTSAGEASGTLTVDGVQLGMLVLQGATYLRAPESFWAGDSPKNGITRRYGGNWVRVPPKVFGLDVGAVLAPAALARSQHPVIAGVPEGHVGDLDASSVNGVRSVKVEAQGTVYELSADQPYRLLRLSTPAVPKFTAPRRFATGSSTIAERGGTFGPAPRAAVPPKPGTPVPAAPDAKDLRVDLTDASADLARVYAELASRAGQLSGAIDGGGKVKLGAQDFVGCGAGSCTITVNFTNEAATATRVGMHADWEGDAKPIGTCDGTSGPVAAHRTGTVTCTISSGGWTAFYQRAISSPGGLSYGARYSVLPLARAPDAARLAADVTAATCATGATRPARCPAAAPGGAEAWDAAVRVGYGALKQRFARSVPYGGVGGLRLAGAAPPTVHPRDGYPDLVVFFGDRLYVYQVADATTAERARQQVGRHLSALRGGLFDQAMLADPGPPIGTVTVRDPHLGRSVTLSSRDGYPGVIFYSVR